MRMIEIVLRLEFDDGLPRDRIAASLSFPKEAVTKEVRRIRWRNPLKVGTSECLTLTVPVSDGYLYLTDRCSMTQAAAGGATTSRSPQRAQTKGPPRHRFP